MKRCAVLEDLQREIWLRRRNSGNLVWIKRTDNGKAEIPIKDLSDAELDECIISIFSEKDEIFDKIEL